MFETPIAAEKGLSVLSPATQYLFQTLQSTRCADPENPTPCPGWNLADLLGHLHTSLGDLNDILGAKTRPRRHPETSPDPSTDIVGTIKNIAIEFVVSWLAVPAPDWKCEIADRLIPANTLLYVAATEMVLHSWDILQACGSLRPIPDHLAEMLLPAAPWIAQAGASSGVFAAAIPISSGAHPGRRLLAAYGRGSE